MSAANTELHIAAAMGDINKIRILLAEGARPDAENTFGKLPEELTGNAAIKSILRDARVAIARKEHAELEFLRSRVAELEKERAILSTKSHVQEYRINFLVRSLQELRAPFAPKSK